MICKREYYASVYTDEKEEKKTFYGFAIKKSILS